MKIIYCLAAIILLGACKKEPISNNQPSPTEDLDLSDFSIIGNSGGGNCFFYSTAPIASKLSQNKDYKQLRKEIAEEVLKPVKILYLL